jgi:folate-binding protein YgfZ
VTFLGGGRAGNKIALVAIHAPPEIESDYRLLRESAGALERDRPLIQVTGPDAVDFVQGQVTNDVAALEPGRGCYALLLNPKGRILADLRILMPDRDELWLDGERVPVETAESNLRMYKIGRQVEVERGDSPTDHRAISIIGPAARDAVKLDPPPDEHAFIRAEVDGASVVAITTDVGIDLIFSAANAASIEALVSTTKPVCEDAAEILRIERGRPRFGVDMSDENLPGELGLEERAVSFTKGCYVGQEPVARMHHRGHPNRHLRGLVLSQPARRGDPVTSGNEDAAGVGTISSATVSPALGPIALSLVRREVEVGAQVLVGGAPAKVVRLPFEGS